MDAIIEALESMKAYYTYDIERFTKDIEHQLDIITETETRITSIREKIRKSQAFIDQYDAAIQLLHSQV